MSCSSTNNLTAWSERLLTVTLSFGPITNCWAQLLVKGLAIDDVRHYVFFGVLSVHLYIDARFPTLVSIVWYYVLLSPSSGPIYLPENITKDGYTHSLQGAQYVDSDRPVDRKGIVGRLHGIKKNLDSTCQYGLGHVPLDWHTGQPVRVLTQCHHACVVNHTSCKTRAN